MTRERLRRWGPAVLALIAFAVVSVAVVPRIQADGSARVTTYDLGVGQPAPGLRARGDIERTLDGFAVRGLGSASVSFTAAAPRPRTGEKQELLVTAGTPPSGDTGLAVVDAERRRDRIGAISRAVRRPIDVTDAARAGPVRVQFTATSFTTESQLFADQVIVATYPPDATPRASRWEVAGWVLLGAVAGLIALRRLRRDALLPAGLALTAWLSWPDIKGSTFDPLSSELWDVAVDAKWLDIDQGLVSGTFGSLSSLAVQLFHSLTPITGTGTVGARTASMLVGVGAVVAVYVLGKRVAGTLGAATAVACALLTDAFRLNLTSGDASSTLVLAAALFLVAVHRALEGADRQAMAWLGAAGGLAILAEPLWWPGVVAAMVLVAVRCAPDWTTRRVLVTGFAVLALVSLPSRVSVAHQADGDITGDVVERATTARNIDFLGRGHGAPATEAERQADPAGGEEVGLVKYVLGEHSLSVVVGGTLSGGYDGLDATGERPESKLPGLIAFLVQLVGVAYLLLIPRLRLLAVAAALVALVPWFFASREAVGAFTGGTPFWPALLAGAAALAYAVREAVRRR